jgi:putative ABC transport system permease protein
MSDRLFRALLRLLPEDLRAGYAREIEGTFRAERREARGRLRRTGLWAGTVWDLLRSLPGQHWEVLQRDGRYAFRLMRSQPVLSAAAVVTLALGIAANVAMFAVADAVLLAPLPYGDARRVVLVEERAADRDPGNMGYLTFLDVRARSRSFETMAAASQSFASLAGDGREPERVNGMRVSASYFDVLGVRPAIGRGFRESEDRPGAFRRVAVLSDRLWRRRFGASPDVVGRGIAVAGNTFTVVGVMPRGFDDLIAERLYGGAEVWFPLGYDPSADFACRTCRHLRVFGRLAGEVEPAAAETEVTGVLRTLQGEHPTQYDRPGSRIRRLQDVFLGPVRPIVMVLWAGVAALLLIACLNVANLLLLRANERRHEMAVRAALGVTRGRLSRQLLTESLILASLGGVAALFPAWLAIRLVAEHGPSQLPRLADAALDMRALAACFGVTAASGLIFGLIPLRQLGGRDLGPTLHGSGRRTDTRGTWRARAVLAGSSVALAALLLVFAGLLVRTMTGLLAVEPGFDAEGVVTADVVLSGSRYAAPSPGQEIAKVTGFYTTVLERLRGYPGVERASAVTTLPLGGELDQFGLHVAGRLHANPEEAPTADRFVVQGDFFQTLRIPLIRGRLFDPRDGAGAPLVAIVNRAAADEIFRGEDPLGHRVMLGPPDAPPRTIVGIVGDTRHQGLDGPAGPPVYVPHAQWAWAECAMTLLVRGGGDGTALAGAPRQAVHSVDPDQPVSKVREYRDIVATSIAARRFTSRLLAVFSVAAVLLAVVGLYGTVGVMVALRRREIGVRLALGADAGSVRRMILAQGMRPAVAGLLSGLALAAVGVTGLRSLLYGVQSRDPVTFAAVAVLLLAVTAAACLGPMWRAGRVNPASALRTE